MNPEMHQDTCHKTLQQAGKGSAVLCISRLTCNNRIIMQINVKLRRICLNNQVRLVLFLDK